jgi:acetylornithine deacetylase/succinyl-diaminopimelate desuccinylase-like protein
MSLAEFQSWAAAHRDRFREEYFEFLRFKSISTDPAFEKDVRNCAKWLSDYVAKYTGMKTELIETEGYPLIYAEDVGRDAPTVLVYGHYDVQPVDPIELWKSPPFEPTIRDGKVYARGAVDDKGQIFYAIQAVRAWKEMNRQLPINLKFCIEGEEESSSVGLSKSLPHLKEKLKCDALLIVDFGAFDETTPALSLGARGLTALEVTITGSTTDLHSGMYGGLAYNPNRAMAELLSKLWDSKGRVQVPGFYDDCVEVTAEQQKEFAFRFDGKELFGAKAGEKDRTPMEANCFRPTLEINGMFGGYTGAGMKTVIPAIAKAKITCRLVPNQDPMKIAKLIGDFLKKEVEPGMKVDVEIFGGDPAFRGRVDSDLAKAVSKASSEVCGKPCVKIVSGASIPIMAQMLQVLQCDAVGMGYGLPSDDIHAPNENFDMERFEKGFLTVARTLEHL